MFDKYCPTIDGKCIGDGCVGHYTESRGVCQLDYTNTKEKWKQCPRNNTTVKIFGKTVYDYTKSECPTYRGTSYMCGGCKYRRKLIIHRCALTENNIIVREFVKDGDIIE